MTKSEQSYAESAAFPPDERDLTDDRGLQVLAAEEINDELWGHKAVKSLPIYFYAEASTQWIREDDIQEYESNKAKHCNPKKQQKTIQKAMKECEDPDFVFISPKELAARRVETDRDDDGEEEEEEEDDAEEEDGHNGLNGGKDRPKQKAARKRSADDGASAPKRKKTSEAKETKKADEKKERSPSDRLFSLRHKLQKTFLSDTLKTEEFPRVDEYLKRVEHFDVSTQLLRETKIAKVLKKIESMEIENEPANIRERCRHILNKWQDMLKAISAERAPQDEEEAKTKEE